MNMMPRLLVMLALERIIINEPLCIHQPRHFLSSVSPSLLLLHTLSLSLCSLSL